MPDRLAALEAVAEAGRALLKTLNAYAVYSFGESQDALEDALIALDATAGEPKPAPGARYMTQDELDYCEEQASCIACQRRQECGLPREEPALLPTDPADKAIVDELVRKATAGAKTRTIEPRPDPPPTCDSMCAHFVEHDSDEFYSGCGVSKFSVMRGMPCERPADYRLREAR